MLRKPEVDKVEFSIGGIKVTDHSIIEMKQDQIIGVSEHGNPKAVAKIKRRHAPPVEALLYVKRSYGQNLNFGIPPFQVIRSKGDFGIFLIICKAEKLLAKSTILDRC